MAVRPVDAMNPRPGPGARKGVSRRCGELLEGLLALFLEKVLHGLLDSRLEGESPPGGVGPELVPEVPGEAGVHGHLLRPLLLLELLLEPLNFVH